MRVLLQSCGHWAGKCGVERGQDEEALAEDGLEAGDVEVALGIG